MKTFRLVFHNNEHAQHETNRQTRMYMPWAEQTHLTDKNGAFVGLMLVDVI